MEYREILFRGKTIGGDWVEGLLSISKGIYGMNNVSPGSYISNKAGMPWAFQIRPETLGQYIGLKDKSGEKIFEGDAVRFIVHYSHVSGPPLDIVCIVSPDPANPGWCLLDPRDEYFYESDFVKCGAAKLEIIGNIHDSPELLTKPE